MFPRKAEYRPHERYIKQLPPNETFTFKRSRINGGTAVTWHTDRWGFRVKQTTTARRKPLIMVYGDSNILAMFSKWENTFVEKLKIKLRRKTGKQYDLINAGVHGFGPDQVALRIEEEFDFWKPELIIVHIFADNDFGDIFRNKLFRIDSDGNLYEVKQQTRRTVVVSRDLRQKTIGFLMKLNLFKAAQKISLLRVGNGRQPHWERKLSRLFRLIEEEYTSYLTNDEVLGGDHYDLDIALNPSAMSSVLKIQLMQKIVHRIKGRVQRSGNTKVLFLVQPSIIDVSTNAELNYKLLQDLFFSSYHRRNLTGAVEKGLKKNQVDFVSLYDHFLTEGKTKHIPSLIHTA